MWASNLFRDLLKQTPVMPVVLLLLIDWFRPFPNLVTNRRLDRRLSSRTWLMWSISAFSGMCPKHSNIIMRCVGCIFPMNLTCEYPSLPLAPLEEPATYLCLIVPRVLSFQYSTPVSRSYVNSLATSSYISSNITLIVSLITGR